MRCCVLLVLLLQAAAPATSDVKGRILLKTGATHGSLDVRVGNEGAVFPILDAEPLMMTTFGPLTWDETKGLSFHYKTLPAGKRLLLAAWRIKGAPSARGDTGKHTHWMDWQWVEVKPPQPKATSSEIVLTVEPVVAGDVEISLTGGVAAESVSFIPADAEGKVPNWDERKLGTAFHEKVADGKAVFKGMKPGKYVFFPATEAAGAPSPQTAVEVKAKAVTQATLGEEKK